MVEWKKLGSISEIGTGSNNREDACENGLYPFYVRSKEVLRINSYLYDEEAILIPGEGGIGEIFHYINGKYGLHQRTYRIHPVSNDSNGRYIYYYLYENFGKYIEQKSYKSTAASIRKPMLLDFPIAIPSLPEQNRIVRFLDIFTASIENLKQQIAERRKQYEYYRDRLLDLEGKEEVAMKSLGEICEKIVDGSHNPPKGVDHSKNLLLSSQNIRNGGIDYNGARYISDEDYSKENRRTNVSKGDVLLTIVGTIGRTCVLSGNEGHLVFQRSVAILKPKPLLSSFFLMYFLQTKEKQLNAESKGGAQKGIYLNQLGKIKVSVPPLSEQSRIVSILDTFEASIANLEAQLKEREKQYEYYRNKLLTFD